MSSSMALRSSDCSHELSKESALVEVYVWNHPSDGITQSFAEVTSVDHDRCPHARARGWAARCSSTCSIGLVGAAAAGQRRRFHFSDIPVRGDDGTTAPVRPVEITAGIKTSVALKEKSLCFLGRTAHGLLAINHAPRKLARHPDFT